MNVHMYTNVILPWGVSVVWCVIVNPMSSTDDYDTGDMGYNMWTYIHMIHRWISQLGMLWLRGAWISLVIWSSVTLIPSNLVIHGFSDIGVMGYMLTSRGWTMDILVTWSSTDDMRWMTIPGHGCKLAIIVLWAGWVGASTLHQVDNSSMWTHTGSTSHYWVEASWSWQ